ncbi:MAG: hypothetical protein RR626_03530, partial [Anaerovoracaceae bacterium]
MTMNLLIQCLVAALACAGLIGGIYALFFGEGASSNRQKGSPMGMLRGFIDAKEDMEVDRVLKKAGIHLTSIQYSLYRVIAVTLILVVGIVSAYAMEGLSPIGVALVLTLLLLLLSLPKEEILGKKSPFLRITGKLEQGRRAKLDNELFDSCITLKNLAIV